MKKLLFFFIGSIMLAQTPAPSPGGGGGGTSGNATQVNGATVPLSLSCAGTNGAGQIITGTCNAPGYMGQYSSAVTYSINQLVTDLSGNTYISKASANTANALPTGQASNTYWQFVGGPTSVTGPAGGDFCTNSTYPNPTVCGFGGGTIPKSAVAIGTDANGKPIVATSLAGGVNSQTTNYTLTSGDNGYTVVLNGTSLTATLPATPPSANWTAIMLNINVSPATVSPNGQLINGSSATFLLQANQSSRCSTDGTNYFCSLPAVSSTTFANLGSGTNTTASYVCGSGCSISTSGTGTNIATSLPNAALTNSANTWTAQQTVQTIIPTSSNVYNLGGASNYFANLYTTVANVSSISATSNITTSGGIIRAGQTNSLGWAFRSQLLSTVDGNVTVENNAGTGIGGINFGAIMSSKGGSNYNILFTDSGTQFDNTGDSAAQTFTLPTPVRGQTFSLDVVAAFNSSFVATGSAIICNGTTCGAANGNIISATPHSTVTLRAISTTAWDVIAITGTWAVN